MQKLAIALLIIMSSSGIALASVESKQAKIVNNIEKKEQWLAEVKACVKKATTNIDLQKCQKDAKQKEK